MPDKAIEVALELAAATRRLRLHLEAKQEALQQEEIQALNRLLTEETLIVKRVKNASQAFDAELRRLKAKPRQGGYGKWLTEQIPQLDEERQRTLLLLAEDTIACQELQVRQQELMQRSLIYYQSMTRLISGVREYTYAPPKPQQDN